MFSKKTFLVPVCTITYGYLITYEVVKRIWKRLNIAEMLWRALIGRGEKGGRETTLKWQRSDAGHFFIKIVGRVAGNWQLSHINARHGITQWASISWIFDTFTATAILSAAPWSVKQQELLACLFYSLDR